MKKVIIGFAVLGIYLIYSLGIRHQQPLIPKPTSLSSNTSSSGSLGTKPNARTTNNTTTTNSTPTNNSAPASSPSTTTSGSQYNDGTYTGSVADAYYGNVQVAVTVSGGKITNVKFLQYPDTHSTSVYINQQAIPYLQQETIQSQNANVQIISGATFTSQAFIQSLQSALNKA